MRAKLYFLFMLFMPCTFPIEAAATPVLFNFNTLTGGINSKTGPDMIETYMETLYGSNITVNLGAQTRKSKVESRPSGLYLGNSDLAIDKGPFSNPPGHADPKDTFLINRWNASLPSTVRDRIVITFEDKPIGSIELDWEIFPVTQNGQNADITIKADGNTIFYQALFGLDKEKGDLGHFGPYFFPITPVKTIEVIDWNDAPIGIDNLSVTQPVPEPGSLLLLGAGLTGLVAWKLRRK